MERTLAKSEKPAHAANRSAKAGQAVAAHAGTLHDRLGNAAVDQMLRSRTLQRKRTVSTPDDPWELEAERVAAAVSAGSSVVVGERSSDPVVQRACGCGGTCDSCEEDEELFRSADPASAIAPDADARVDAMLRSSGTPLDPESRAHFEPLFGRDFGDVRIHTDQPAQTSATSLAADAYTIGTDIAFAANRFDTGTTAGRKLLAHELTHVAQHQPGLQRAGRVHRQPTPDPRAQYANETKDQFAGRVRQRASARLTQNIGVLDEWKNYINTMQGFQLRAQLLTGTVMEHAIAAAPFGRSRERFETEMGTLNQYERAYEGAMLDIEASYRDRTGAFMAFLSSKAVHGHWTTPSIAQRMQVMSGELGEEDLPPSVYVPPDPRYRHYAGTIQRFESGESGGCQTCHEINYFWQKTAEEYGEPLPSGDLGRRYGRLMPDFGAATATPLSTQERDLVLQWLSVNQPSTSSGLSPVVPQQAAGTASSAEAQPSMILPPAQTATATAAPNPFVPAGPLPAGVDVPRPRTNLCGDLPPAEDSQRTPNLASWGPNSAVAARVIENIDAVLLPLGPRGYRVLGRQTFDSLWATRPDQMEGVRAGILSRITAKQGEYRTLQGNIEGGSVPYEELCPIVDELLPDTNDFVKWQVREDVRRWQERERILMILELTLLALSIIFPPSMLVTLPAGLMLGLARISLGIDQRRQGEQWGQGTGAGVYSRSQEAEAPGLASRGRNNIIAGALSVGLSAASLARILSEARASAQLLEAIQTGAVIQHAEYPGIYLLTRNGRLLMITEQDDVLGYGMIQNGQVFWTRLNVPYNPFTPAGGATGATGTSIVPYGSTGIVPYGSTGIVPYGSTAMVPFGQSTALPFGATPFGGMTTLGPGSASSLALPTVGTQGPLLLGPGARPLMFGPGAQPLLLGPGHQPLLLGPGPTVPAIDPGGRGLFTMSEVQISRLPVADAARLRTLQGQMPASPAELRELCRLRRTAAGTELAEIAGTPEHMLARWNQYSSQPTGASWSFQRWAAGHPSRMRNSISGVAREEQYRLALAEAGVPSRSGVLTTTSGQTRQGDIVIEGGRGGTRDIIQIKAGEESLTTTPRQSGGASRGSSSLSNEAALRADRELIDSRDRVTWVFEARPSGPLVARARELEVNVIIRVDDAAGQAHMIQLMRRAGMTQEQIDTVTFVIGTREDVVAFVVQRFGAR